MMNLEQNFLALDLELNLDATGTPKKIIQVGIAIGNMGNPTDIKTHSWYINPCERYSCKLRRQGLERE